MSVEWVVVGAGVTGLSCARRLAERCPNDQILLLEARELAQGATARSSGFAVEVSRRGGPVGTADIKDCQRVNRINRAGLNSLREIIKASQIDCDWNDQGIYHVAADRQSRSEYRHFVDSLEMLAIDHRPLSRDALKEELGTEHYHDGVFVQAGALVQPAALVRGLAGCLPKNVRLHERSPVLELRQGPVHELLLPNARVRAKNVVLATNYEVADLGFFKSRVTGAVLSGSFTRQLEPDEFNALGRVENWGCLSLHASGATVRLTADRRICIRNTIEFRNSRLLSDADLERRVAQHRAGFEARFPQLADVPFEYSWSGVEGISRNRTNFFGALADRLWFAGGYNGSGLSRGTAFGLTIADFACGDANELVEDCGRVAEAQWMPPEPLRSLAGNFVARRHSAAVGRDV